MQFVPPNFCDLLVLSAPLQPRCNLGAWGHGGLLRNGEELRFSVMEYQLLEILISNRGRRVSREILLDSVWDGHGDLPEDNSLSVYIARIRKKLKEIDLEGAIETCYGRGYCWIEPQNR